MCFTDMKKYMYRINFILLSLQSISHGYKETSTTWWAGNAHKGVQIRPNHKSFSLKSQKNFLKDCLGDHFSFILIHYNSFI